MFFFNKEINNPFLKTLIAFGAAIFVLGIVVLVLLFLLPLIGVAVSSAVVITIIAAVLVVLIVPVLSFFGILLSNRKKGNGIKEVKTFKVSDFNVVKVNKTFKLNVTCGQVQEITVTTDSNLLEYVDISVKAEKLHVSLKRAVSTSLGVVVNISLPCLNELLMSGATTAKVTSISNETFKLKSSGASKTELLGKSDVLEIKISGASSVYAKELEAEKAILKVAGAAKVTLFASKSFDATLAGASKVVCYGKPEMVTKTISGAAKMDFL